MSGAGTADLRVVPLDGGHDRAAFTCGIEGLDRYLKIHAGQDQRRKANAVFVLCRVSVPSRILGFYTLCATALAAGDIPDRARRHLPRYPLVSCTLVGRLAIARDAQRQGMGTILVADALLRCLRSADSVGSSMVVVDALDEAAAAFYAAHGFVRLMETSRLIMPMREIRPSPP